MVPEHIDVRAGWTAANPAKLGLATIIIPNYNHALYLPAAIESALAQSYPHVEIIVVDDGSTDHSRAVIDRFQDRICPIFQKNQGLSAARNSGLKAARGEFIAVLDADDRYEPDFLATMVPLLQSRPEAAAVTCGYRFVDEHNRPLPQIEARDIPPEALFDTLARGNFLVPESILVRRAIYEKVGLFDPELRACEDLDMWLRIARDQTILNTTAVLTRHRILAGSMSTDPERMHLNRLKVLQIHLGGDDRAGFNEPAQQLSLGYAYLTSAVEYLQIGNLEMAYTQFRAAAGTEPRLLTQPEAYYELMLGPQPKGWRGDFDTVETDANFAVASDFVNRLLADAGVSLRQTVSAADLWAQLNLTAGLISYGQGRGGQALRHFGRAIAKRPAYMLKRPLISRTLKTILGIKWLKDTFTR